MSSIFGHKVNTCVPGTKPINGMYPACKFALTALTECLRQEVAFIEMGIKVSVREIVRRMKSLSERSEKFKTFVCIHFSFQNISPGLVENDILTTSGTDNNELVKFMPRLKPEDVAKAIIFIISNPSDVLVSFSALRPSSLP